MFCRLWPCVASSISACAPSIVCLSRGGDGPSSEHGTLGLGAAQPSTLRRACADDSSARFSGDSLRRCGAAALLGRCVVSIHSTCASILLRTVRLPPGEVVCPRVRRAHSRPRAVIAVNTQLWACEIVAVCLWLPCLRSFHLAPERVDIKPDTSTRGLGRRELGLLLFLWLLSFCFCFVCVPWLRGH